MNSVDKLNKIKSEGIFTAGQSFDQFVSDLCKRFTRMYDEILPVMDYDYIIAKLEEKGILEPEDDSDGPLTHEPIYL